MLLLLLFLLAALTVPMLLLAGYAVPAADDFSFSCETHAALCSGAALPEILAGAVKKVISVYNTWQGTFSAIFLMACRKKDYGMPLRTVEVPAFEVPQWQTPEEPWEQNHE